MQVLKIKFRYVAYINESSMTFLTLHNSVLLVMLQVNEVIVFNLLYWTLHPSIICSRFLVWLVKSSTYRRYICALCQIENRILWIQNATANEVLILSVRKMVNIGTVWTIMVNVGQASPGQVRSSQVRSGQVKSGQVRSDQIRSDQIRSGQV